MPAETDRSVAVLAWHKIGAPPADGWETWNYVPESVFVEQLETVQGLGFEILDLQRFLNGLADPSSLPPRSALLTFDDGYASMLSVAQPLLERFDYPSVLFVPTGYIGDTNGFDQDNEPVEAICGWDDLRELQRRGMAVQSHSVSHRDFSKLGEDEQRIELANSKSRLESELDAPVQLFAYPYGAPGQSNTTDALLADLGYRAAFLYKGGPISFPAETYRLGRVPMGPDTNLRKHLGDAA